jgi:hypothetical protein
MAKTLIPPTSGSVGGQTFSRNRSGAYIRQRSNPTQPRTAAQVNARARLTSTSAAWRGLTDAQRAGWSAFAQSFTVVNSLGTTINLTGAQCYVKVNTVNLLNGDAVVSTPPALPVFVACLVTGLTATAGTQLLEANGSSPASGTKYMFYVSPQVSAGVSFNGRFAYLATFTTATSSEFVLTSTYTAKFGALIAGKKVFVKCVQSQAGMQDNGTLFATIVGA